MSDRELVLRLVEGDHWAKEALYRRYVRSIWGTALRLMGNPSDAEDVVQDTFAEALRDLPKLERLESLRPWLMRIAVHQAHRRFRRRRTLRLLGLDRDASDTALAALADPGASPEVHAELARLDRALSSLSLDERFAWMLRHVEGYALEEAALVCGCSLATVKRRLAKASRAVALHLNGADHG